VSVSLTDLKHPGLELQFGPKEWTRILQLLLAQQVISGEDLFCWSNSSRVEVPLGRARRIGAILEKKLIDDVRESARRPVIPGYIRPISTSNGLWIDPALPLLNRPELDPFYLRFAAFCRMCSGFSIGQ
jgi:hypothetical protein